MDMDEPEDAAMVRTGTPRIHCKFCERRHYHREFGVALQFCLAHLIRDVKYLTTLPDPRDRAYGRACAKRCGTSSL